MNEIIHKDAKDLNIKREIDLTVTSPPYANAINYDKHVEEEDYSDRKEISIKNFIKNQKKIFKKVKRNTSEGGFCCIIIGMSKKKDSTSKVALPHRFATMMEDIGWNLHESIVWHKVTSGSTRFGVTVQHPYPGYYYPNQMHEEIQVWKKGSKNRLDKKEEDEININDFVKKEISNNLWNIAPEPPQKYNKKHPCPFPEEIPYRLIKLYSNTGDLVFDPMAGIGTTLKVAKHLNRDSLGCDISKEYVESAKERIKNEKFERRPQIMQEFNKKESEKEI